MTKRGSWYFQIWSGIFEHRDKLGSHSARWEFDWCVWRTTEEIRLTTDQPIWGLIYGGKPVPLSQIAQETHTGLRTVERHFRILRVGGYIFTVSRGNRGLQIAVRNSKKWPRKAPKFVPFPTIQAVLDDRFGKKSKVPKVARQKVSTPPQMAGQDEPRPDTTVGVSQEPRPDTTVGAKGPVPTQLSGVTDTTVGTRREGVVPTQEIGSTYDGQKKSLKIRIDSLKRE